MRRWFGDFRRTDGSLWEVGCFRHQLQLRHIYTHGLDLGLDRFHRGVQWAVGKLGSNPQAGFGLSGPFGGRDGTLVAFLLSGVATRAGFQGGADRQVERIVGDGFWYRVLARGLERPDFNRRGFDRRGCLFAGAEVVWFYENKKNKIDEEYGGRFCIA